MPRKARVESDTDKELSRLIGGRLKAVREEIGVNAIDMAKQLGVSLAQQYRLETGKRLLDAVYLHKLGVGFDVNLDLLLRGGQGAPAEVAATREPVMSAVQKMKGSGSYQIANTGGDIKHRRISR
ncbi:MAG: helix-turn-helix domain-containing protein [Betaproteobacteria bacterium]|jgi:transcriptional regulator with XRE-family HTH domain|nr:helix-turn-helix domain-containing protein [Rubrivivax sp.]